jgi:hypothetical protein
MRTHLNRILHGPSTQQKALDKLWKEGVIIATMDGEFTFIYYGSATLVFLALSAAVTLAGEFLDD